MQPKIAFLATGDEIIEGDSQHLYPCHCKTT